MNKDALVSGPTPHFVKPLYEDFMRPLERFELFFQFSDMLLRLFKQHLLLQRR